MNDLSPRQDDGLCSDFRHPFARRLHEKSGSDQTES
jgi:hypothetical protein